ncbi:MAG: Hpt domain-containing protein [Pirellulaceae bacterium]
MTETLQEEAIFSAFGPESDLFELVEMFVADLPDRIATLETTYAQQRWEELRRTAHQLKGASGSYGFHQITPYAAALEIAVRDMAPTDEIQRHLVKLVNLCRRLRARQPN